MDSQHDLGERYSYHVLLQFSPTTVTHPFFQGPSLSMDGSPLARMVVCHPRTTVHGNGLVLLCQHHCLRIFKGQHVSIAVLATHTNKYLNLR